MDLNAWASGSHVGALRLAHRLVSLESPALVLETEQRPQRASPKGMPQHRQAVAQPEPGIVPQGGRQVTQLHPSFRPPSEEFDVFGGQMLAPNHCGGAVVLFDVLADD